MPIVTYQQVDDAKSNGGVIHVTRSVTDKIITSITVTLITACAGGGLLMWRQQALQGQRIDMHDRMLSLGDRYTQADARADRQAAAEREAAILNALTELQRSLNTQNSTLSALVARLDAIAKTQERLQSIIDRQRDP